MHSPSRQSAVYSNSYHIHSKSRHRLGFAFCSWFAERGARFSIAFDLCLHFRFGGNIVFLLTFDDGSNCRGHKASRPFWKFSTPGASWCVGSMTSVSPLHRIDRSVLTLLEYWLSCVGLHMCRLKLWLFSTFQILLSPGHVCFHVL